MALKAKIDGWLWHRLICLLDDVLCYCVAYNASPTSDWIEIHSKEVYEQVKVLTNSPNFKAVTPPVEDLPVYDSRRGKVSF